jgi:hypothetical protein
MNAFYIIGVPGLEVFWEGSLACGRFIPSSDGGIWHGRDIELHEYVFGNYSSFVS